MDAGRVHKVGLTWDGFNMQPTEQHSESAYPHSHTENLLHPLFLRECPLPRGSGRSATTRYRLADLA